MRMNQNQLRQVLQNLIANAIHYRKKDVVPKIHVSALKTGEQVHLSVTDNGVGIEEKYFEKVFGLFQRLQRGPAYPGTGLGLAICKKIVERHGGGSSCSRLPGWDPPLPSPPPRPIRLLERRVYLSAV